MNAKPTFALLVLGALCVGGLVALGRGRPHKSAVTPESASEEAPPATEPAPATTPEPAPAPASPPAPPVVAKRPPPAAPPAAVVTEQSLMAEIRELGASDPARALELARDGNRRFPNSADAGERTWTICKSLAALGRFSEAQDEARRLVHQYPDTNWASDVRHHLLTQPLEDPSQRGYGKSSELD